MSGEDLTPDRPAAPADDNATDPTTERPAAVEPDVTPPGADPICPYLGLVGDPNAHHTFPSRTHLCYAGEPAHVGLGFQVDFCLGGRYPDCARFQRAEAAGAQAPHAAAVAPAPVAFTSGERLRIRTGERRSGPSLLVAAMLGLALVGALFAVGLATGIIAIPGSSPAAVVGTPTAPPTGSALPSASLSPSPLETATTTAAPTASPTAIATDSPTPGPVTHVVQPGESLTSIALLYGVTIEAIVVANGITNPDLIMAGTVLIIPVDASGSPLPVPTPTPGPTASDGTTIYIVQAGDTLSDIAIRFGVTVQAIQAANGIENPDTLFVGQQLIIPAPP